MTAGEKVFASWASLVGHLQAMNLPQVGINLALTAVIVVAALLSVGNIGKLARVAARQPRPSGEHLGGPSAGGRCRPDA